MVGQRIVVALVILAAIVPLLAPWMATLLTLAAAIGFAALGVALLLRAGLISIGLATFYTVGAYSTAFLTRAGVTDLLALLVLAVLVSCLGGAIVGMFVVRYRGIFFAMLNLAVSMVLFTLLARLYRLTGGTDGIGVATPTLLGMNFARDVFGHFFFYFTLGLVVLIGLAIHRYYSSPLGRALDAVHTNELRLEYVGISAWQLLLTAYTLSAALAGLGGALAAVTIGRASPEFAYWMLSGQLVLIAVLGGIGGVSGPFIGAAFFEVVRSFAMGHLPYAWNMIMGTALLAVIFFMPGGLYGLAHFVTGVVLHERTSS